MQDYSITDAVAIQERYRQECDGDDCQGCPACPDIPATVIFARSPWYQDQLRAARQADLDNMGPISEAALAELFYRKNRGSYAYVYSAETWRVWTGQRWEDTPAITEEIYNFLNRLLGGWSNELTKADAAKWLSRSAINSVAALAQAKFARAIEWDRYPNILGLPGGCKMDTTTGEIFELYWFDYLSRHLPDSVGGEWDEPIARWDTPSLKFDNFVWDALAHYPLAERYAVKDYLQTWAGAALTGDANANQAMVFLYGIPGTGKSTYAETLLSVFGSYGASVSGGRVARENNQHPQWLAGLEGKRLVTINELPARGNWQSQHLDSLVDGGTVEANRMRQDSINFHSSAFVLATGNHRPSAPTGDGIWRRLRIIMFQAKPDEPNPHLGKELRADLPGVFAWVLAGLDRYRANGYTIPVPDVIRADTTEYEVDADPMRQFIDDCLISKDDARVEVKALYTAYEQWHEVNGTGKPMSGRAFGNRLNDAGYAHAETARDGKQTVRYRHGVGLLG